MIVMACQAIISKPTTAGSIAPDRHYWFCPDHQRQEPGSNEEIQFFCTEKYDVSFNIFNKIDVNGKDTDPFYDFLKNERPGVMGTKNIKWNFSKFLVNKDGEVVKRYGPTTKPESIESDIIKLL